MPHQVGSFLLGKHFTSQPDRMPRLRVDSAQTGFFEGREFRSYYEFSIAAGATARLKYTANTEFILFNQTLTVDAGGIRFTAVAAATEATAFSSALPIIGKNRMLERLQPYYNAANTIHSGGTYSGGTVVEVVRVVASQSTAQESTVGGLIADERGLPEGVYFLNLENISNGTATGVYSLFWEERV